MTGVFFIYLIGLHTGISIMEMASWTLVALVLFQKIRRRERVWFPMWKPMTALVAAVGVGLVVNPASRTFLEQFGFMRWIVLMYFFAWFLADHWNPRFEERLVKFWIVLLVVTGTYSTFQCLTGIDLVRPAAKVLELTNHVWRATGFFSMCLTFAYCIGFSFFAVSLPSQRLRPRVWGVLTLVFGFLAVMSSVARGAWVAMTVVGLVYFFCSKPRLAPWIATATAAAIGFLSLLPNGIGTKINDMIHFRVDHSEMMRFHLWQGYWAIWKDHPFFGAGLFQGDLLLPEYYQRLGIVEPFVSHSHNVLLGWLAGAGVIGLAIYVWISIEFLRMAWRLRLITPWGWSLFLAQIYLHIGGLTENNFFDAEVNHWEMLGWAMILALTHVHQKKLKEAA